LKSEAESLKTAKQPWSGQSDSECEVGQCKQEIDVATKQAEIEDQRELWKALQQLAQDEAKIEQIYRNGVEVYEKRERLIGTVLGLMEAKGVSYGVTKAPRVSLTCKV
jgi:hypothetical protein